MQRRVKHPDDLKRLCIGEIKQGRPYAQVAKQRRVKESTIRGWVQRALAEAAARASVTAPVSVVAQAAPPATPAKAPQVSAQRELSRCEAERAELNQAVAALALENIALKRRLGD